jgi:hypothetical protein
MNLSHPPLEASQVIAVNGPCRWEVYRRLQELEIPCECSTERPLRASISTPTAAMQIWSTVRQITASRRELVLWLQDCWQLKTDVEEA